MFLIKTLQATAALAAKDRSLAPRERQLLILCDGARDVASVMKMMAGTNVAAVAQGLMARGFLVAREQPETRGQAATTARASRHGPRGEDRLQALAAQTTTQEFRARALAGAHALGAPTDRSDFGVGTTGGPQPGDSADPYLQNARPPAATSLATAPDVLSSLTAPLTSPGGLSVSRTKRSLAGAKMYVMDLLQMQRHPEASGLAVSIHTSDDETELVAALIEAWRFIHRRSGSSYAQQVAEKLTLTLPERWVPDVERARWDLG